MKKFMSFKAEVVESSAGKWQSNGNRFATYEEADEYAQMLGHRWTAVRNIRVTESSEPVTHHYNHGRLYAIE